MKPITLAILAGLTVVACGDDDTRPADIDQVKACVARGGHAVFSSDQNGNVYYIACEE